MQGYALFLLGITMGMAGLGYLKFRASRRKMHEIMLGTVMSIIGWVMGLIGFLIVIFS